MKQISIISAKGGVGKTTIAAAFASLARNFILVDCDAESTDLRLLLKSETIETNKVHTIQRVRIEEDDCIRCGLCKALCHFDAVENNYGVYKIKEVHCQACDLCLKACPVSAIEHIKTEQNQWSESDTAYGKLVFAQLALGEDLNGNLIAILRDRAQELAEENKSDIILIDGPPAVGFAVAAAIAGANVAVVVIEPAPSAIHDLHKSQQLANRYEVPIVCLINKSDLNPEMTEKVKEYCIENTIPLIGEIPFSSNIMETQLQGNLIDMQSGDNVVKEINLAWKRLLEGELG